MKGTVRIALAIALLVGSQAAVGEEAVVLKNGDRITGDVKKIWDGEVYIEPSYADEFAIDMDEVAAIESDEIFEFEMKDETEFDGVPNVSPTGETVVTTDAGQVQALSLAAIEEMNEPEDYFDWSVMTDLSVDISKGNSDAEAIRWYSKGYTKFGDHKHTLEYTLSRQESNGERSREEDDFRYTYNWSFAKRWGAYGLLGYLSDPIRDLDKRVSVGAGLDYEVWDSAARAWTMGFGLDFIDEEIGGETNENTAAHWIFRFSHDLLSGDVEFFHNHDIYYNMTGRDNEVFRSRTGFAYELTDDIDATLQLNYDYETEPAAGFDKDDLQYLIGVKVELD